jgi:putative endonuclease
MLEAPADTGSPLSRGRHVGGRTGRGDAEYYVYILASQIGGTLYIGVTNDLVRRVHEHQTKAVMGFTSRYGVTRLVYFEIFGDVEAAILREKQLKKWKRAWKIRLVEEKNPNWVDLFPSIARL